MNRKYDTFRKPDLKQVPRWHMGQQSGWGWPVYTPTERVRLSSLSVPVAAPHADWYIHVKPIIL